METIILWLNDRAIKHSLLKVSVAAISNVLNNICGNVRTFMKLFFLLDSKSIFHWYMIYNYMIPSSRFVTKYRMMYILLFIKIYIPLFLSNSLHWETFAFKMYIFHSRNIPRNPLDFHWKHLIKTFSHTLYYDWISSFQ